MIGLLSLVLASAGAVTVKLPDLGQLVAAVRSRDEVEVERVAARLGPVRLARIAGLGSREERMAALRAILVVENGWAELIEVARLIADPDEDVAESAAKAARQLAESLTPEAMEVDEVPADVPRRAAALLLEQARRAELRPSLRVSALETVAALRGVGRVDEGAIGKLLADAEPQVRRGAAEALYGARPTAALDTALARTLASDGVAEVAAAAAAAICRDVPATPSKSAAETRATHLAPPARNRLRALALDEQIAIADRLDLAGCLRLFGDAEDKKALDELSRRPPETLRRRARALGGR